MQPYHAQQCAACLPVVLLGASGCQGFPTAAVPAGTAPKPNISQAIIAPALLKPCSRAACPGSLKLQLPPQATATSTPRFGPSSHLLLLQVDTQISAIQTSQQDRLDSMAPSVRQAYSDLLGEQTGLLAEAGRCEEEAAELTAALTAAEGELSRNGFKRRVLEVQVRVLAWLWMHDSSRLMCWGVRRVRWGCCNVDSRPGKLSL